MSHPRTVKSYFLALLEEHGEPDAWDKLYGNRQGEPLTPLEQATVDIARTLDDDAPSA